MGSATKRSRPQIDADGLLAFQKAICDSGINDIMSALVENLSRAYSSAVRAGDS